MSRRVATLDDSPSLFPFLAVLICTLGALVVLLVVMIRQSRVEGESRAELARQASQAARDAAEEEARVQAEDWQWKAQILQQSRDQQIVDLTHKRNELSHLEEHIRRVEQEADQLVRALDKLQQERAGGDSSAHTVADELARMRAEIQRAEQQLKSAREAMKDRKRSYSIVPYDGPRGTHRRPIYIECLGDRIVLQPTGVVLVNADFEPPLGTDNPLAAALRATREYWSQSVAEAGEPYPLLLVRPDGSESYAAARLALREWETEFGYELIPAEMDLAYPASEPPLVELQQRVVDESRQRRLALRRAIPNPKARAYGLVASPQGGFEAVEQDPARVRGADRAQARERNGLGRRQPRSGLATSQSSFGMHSVSNRSGEGRAGEGGAVGLPNGGASDANRYRATPTTTLAARDSQGSARGAAAGGADRAAGLVQDPDGGLSASGSRSQRTGAGAGSRSDQATGEGGGGGTSTDGSEAIGTAPGNGATQSATADSGAGAGLAGASRSSATDGRWGAAPSGATPGATPGGPVAMTPARSGAAAGSPAGSSGGATGAEGGGQGGSMAASAGNSSPAEPGSPPAMSGISAVYSPMQSTMAMQQRKGGKANWALPSQQAGAIPIARPLRAKLARDKLQLLTQRHSAAGVELPMNGGIEPVLEPFITGVWQQMKAWGSAGNGVYWKPTLYVDVAPDASDLFEQLDAALRGSGIGVKRVEP